MDEAFHAFFVFIALLALNFSFVLRSLTDFAGFYGGLRFATGLWIHVMGWCFYSLRSMIRRTDYEFLLQRERSACIAIKIPVRLHQEISYSSNLIVSLS